MRREECVDDAAARHDVDWLWVKGHAGNAMNERADQLARAEIVKMRGR